MHRHKLLMGFAIILAAWVLYAFAEGDLGRFGEYLAAQAGSAFGLRASVPPNQYNVLAQQLKEKETQLSRREQALAALEANGETPAAAPSRLIRYMGIGVGVVFVLVLLNFYLDWRRRGGSEETSKEPSGEGSAFRIH